MERILIGDSEILIGHGRPEPLLPWRESRRMAVVITQPGAAAIARDLARQIPDSEIVTLPDRDEAKTVSVAEGVYHQLADIGFGRHDTVVGVGGGAVTDLAGFVAATWVRGVESVLVPTTLLGAVDAAIGGKTGLNLAGKNLVGAFHLPTRVVIDHDVLAALPDQLRLEGTAEALKAGLIGDPELVDLFAKDGRRLSLEVMVTRAVAVKVGIVKADLREDGRRAILNFGHTIGHAIEVGGGLPHGLAVAVGMVAAGSVSAARYGFPDRWLSELISSLGLPVAVAGVSPEIVLALIARDKKRTAAGVRMVLLREVGDPVIDVVNEREIEVGLSAVGIRD
jgi:3-dehydroquinate synthetase